MRALIVSTYKTLPKTVCLCVLACCLMAVTLPALATVQSIPILADARLSSFDTQDYVRHQHPDMAGNAEAISHWAAYYTVNPILLIQVIRAQAAETVAGPVDVRGLADSLAGLARSGDAVGGLPRETLSEQLAQLFSLDLATAANAVDRAWTEIVKTGMHIQLSPAISEPPAFDLPFAIPRAWQFNGVHTWTGNDDGSPMSSLDFASSWSQTWGSDTSSDWVAAAHDGEVTVYSSCFVQVTHESGWATRYYHLDNVQVTTGQQVLAGETLAVYADAESQALCSGGHSNGPHVHFALLQAGQYTSLDGVELSGYAVHPGTSSYDSSQARMWLEKRDEKHFAYGAAIATEPGDNTIDYRYNGMWFSPQHSGHGLNIELDEFPLDDGSRKTVFVVMYTYDDNGLANFYVGNRDYDRWRSDESMMIEMLQTSGGDWSNLSAIDFEDPSQVRPAGEVELRFRDCGNAEITVDLDERSTGMATAHYLELVKLIGVPAHVCAEASQPLLPQQERP